MITKPLQESLKKTAHILADGARPIALSYFRQALVGLENKDAAGFDPVTLADKQIEKHMRALLAQHRPQDGILAEEYANTKGASGLTWVLDPIDGTRGFISGTPTWGVLIALSDQNGPQFGIIDQPFTGERFTGGFGQAVWSHAGAEHAIKTRDTDALSQAILFSTFPEVGTAQDAKGFRAVSQRCQLTRYGMDCYAYALLAAGQIDLVIEARLEPYDIAAPIAVIQAAGGVVTDWRGGPAHHGGRILAAANRQLHAQALDILSNY